jgi:hypothetical protein
MSEARKVLERALGGYGPEAPGPGLEPLIRRARRRDHRRRLGVAMLAVAVFGVALAATVYAFLGKPKPVGGATGPVSVSTVASDGQLRCTATVPNPLLQPGQPTGVKMILTNLTGHEVRGADYADLTVSDAAGRELWDGLAAFKGIDFPVHVATIPPHGSVAIHPPDVAIRWAGRLILQAACAGLPGGGALPGIPVRVAVPAPAPSIGAALTDTLRAMGGLFDHCLPPLDGSWVTGTIEAPAVAPNTTFPNVPTHVPPMRARCAAQVAVEPGFDVVTVSFVVPADAPAVVLGPYLNMRQVPTLPGHGSLEAGRWVFVVTARAALEAIPLESLVRTAPSSHFTVGYAFEHGVWSGGSTGRCGGSGTATIEFITPCGP